jgi:hypothetical protein
MECGSCAFATDAKARLLHSVLQLTDSPKFFFLKIVLVVKGHCERSGSFASWRDIFFAMMQLYAPFAIKYLIGFRPLSEWRLSQIDLLSRYFFEP